MTNENLIEKAAEALLNANQIAVLTGAGVSKESGVPTFRDAMEGLWAKYDPQELATPTAFRNNPKLVWDWYTWRRDLAASVKPNPGHVALAQLEAHKPTYIITQNVDDLHEQAESTNVIHLHGNIAESKCFDDCQGKPTIIDLSSIEWDQENGPPKCPHCGAWIRPNIVWFGEMLPQSELEQAAQITESCDVMLVIGTSGLVSPASQIPGSAKYSSGATIIEVNPDYTRITPIADIKLQGPSGEMLPKVLEAMG